MDLLVTYIEKEDVHSLEPLLTLLAHFAHDLDTNFEQHFQRAVATVAKVAARIEAPEAIEWSFTCLAWLFKHLSRLLVPDLRPLYDLMAPYLGKGKQKPFIIRFAAEAMSFLLRKAAAVYGKNKKPLDTIIGHILHNVESNATSDLYVQGVMTLLTEAVKGQGLTMHSGANAVVTCVLETCQAILATRGSMQILDILQGSFVSIIHHTDQGNFASMCTNVLGAFERFDQMNARHLQMKARILTTIVGTRKGTRIPDWTSVVQATASLIKDVSLAEPQQDHAVYADALDTLSVVLATAPLETLLPHIKILDALTQAALQDHFLAFCNVLATLDQDRFQSLLLPHLVQYIATAWKSNEVQICDALQRMQRRQVLGNGITIPTAWQQHILSTITNAVTSASTLSTTDISLLVARLDAIDNVSADPELTKTIASELAKLCRTATRDDLPPAMRNLLSGRVFEFVAHNSEPDETLTKTMLDSSDASKDIHAYWIALKTSLQNLRLAGRRLVAANWPMAVIQSITDVLASPSHDLKQSALGVLAESYLSTQSDVPEWLEALQTIQETTPSMQSSRFISMQVRRLPPLYHASEDEVMSTVLPTYCVGLLHVKLAQTWDDAVRALKDILESTGSEDVVMTLLSRWLQGTASDVTGEPQEEAAATWQRVSSDFECSNLNHLLEQCRVARSQSTKETSFETDKQPLTSPNDRGQALRILHAIPQLAEKRSRMLVPVLLQWATGTTSDEDSIRWSRKDQKGMLGVVAQFQNPKVLYKADEVHDALMSLLTNGDVEIQRSALQALLAWKDSHVLPYKAHLENLLDDARFREETSVFLRLDEAEGIRNEDLATIIPLLLRLLYGRVVTRTGLAGGAKGQQSRRKAVFRALASFPRWVLGQFVDLAVSPLDHVPSFVKHERLAIDEVLSVEVAPRKLFGMLNMMEDLLETLGSELSNTATTLADAALLSLVKANGVMASDIVEHASMYANVRQTSMRCLVLLLTNTPELSWQTRLEMLMQHVIGPRLARLPIETAQSISGTLRLFSAISAAPQLAEYLVTFDSRVIPTILDCLVVPSAQLEVKLFVIEEILGKLLDLAALQSPGVKSMLETYSGAMLDRLGTTLRQSPPKNLLDAGVTCISRLAPFVRVVDSIRGFFSVSTFLLQQPNGRVSPKMKHNLLKTLYHLPPLYNFKDDHAVFTELYDAICPLFAFFKDKESRILLCELLLALTSGTKDLEDVASLCADLESYSASRLDEPDYERRSAAIKIVNEDKWEMMTAQMWKPIIYSMLYHIRDNDELAIRTSASYTLRRAIEACSSEKGFKDHESEQLLSAVVLPGLQYGCRNPSELVRTEYLTVLASLVKQCPAWNAVADMQPLLADDDEEAAFFSNILHIQQHRRLRALRRLAEQANNGLSSRNINQILVPLLEHFVFDQTEAEGAQNLAAETVKTLGVLAGCLDWSQYRATLKKFIGYIKDSEGPQKSALRLVGAVIDSLSIASKDDGQTRNLKKTMPSQQKLVTEITREFMPPLTDFLHLKDESTVSLRVPVAVTVVKLIQVLPSDTMGTLLPSVLLDICHILRSKDQVARDLTRRTLAEITGLLGPAYYGFVFKELRSALQRGYQLHVMSYTVHSILVANIDTLKPGDLDYCLPVLMSMIMEDIFGVVGQEKDAEEYISKMKEVKSNKSLDSIEIISKFTTLAYMGEIIKPIQTLLGEKLNHKTIKKVDELLRRIGLGVTQNKAVVDRDVLVFCYEVIRQSTAVVEDAPRAKNDYKTRKFLIQVNAAQKLKGRASTTSYTFKLHRFAFDLVRSVLHKHDELRTPANIVGFLPMLGDALVGQQEEVQLSAVRLLTLLIKVPEPKIERDAPVYAMEAINMIRAASSMTTEAAQAALKLVAAVLRDRPSVRVREQDIAYVLQRVKPDLDEPDRQGVIFSFLKTVLGRKVVITEVYETMDVVAEIMVTNQTRSARDLARGVYFQFLMDFPQGKDRLVKQVNFLVKNLEYRYVEGRKSVLELVHLLLHKTHGDLFQDMSSMLFVPLIMMMANDDTAECREMAGALVSKVLEKADDTRRNEYLGMLRTWLDEEQVLLRRVALQCWVLYLGTQEAQAKDVALLLKHLEQMLPTEGRLIPVEEWELLYYALQLFAKLSETATATMSSSCKPLWTSVFRCLLYPHAWVKLMASSLVGTLMADVSKTQAGALHELPYKTSAGMQMNADELRTLCSSSFRVMRYSDVSEKLVSQTARNLTFLGRSFASNGIVWKEDDTESEDDNETVVRSALEHLFYRLAQVLRREPATLRAQSLYAKTAALQVIGALITRLDKDKLAPSLDTIILPLQHLTDTETTAPSSMDSAFTEGYTGLISLSTEVLSLLQKQLGTADYISAMGRVQAIVRERREGRRQKRRIERVAEPDKAETDKRRRYEGKKAKRKEKGMDARSQRRGW